MLGKVYNLDRDVSIPWLFRSHSDVIHRYYKTDIKGADSGPLLGKSLAIKDCVAVAGVPMMNGSRLVEGYVPEYDATVVTRILDAG